MCVYIHISVAQTRVPAHLCPRDTEDSETIQPTVVLVPILVQYVNSETAVILEYASETDS